jgi:predicted NAD/FAD-binding protein
VKRIAVIGAGISGLAAAYLLSRRHVVTLFEAEPRLGGHTHTIRVDAPGGRVALDTGFLVHNEQTYPNLVRLFHELKIATQASEMSFSVTCSSTGLEYSSRGLAGFFAQPRNIMRLEHYQLLNDIIRFNREAPAILTESAARNWTLGSYVERARFGHSFVARYLAPMTSAIWSASVESVLVFPMQTLVRFMQNHGMLAVGSHPTWRVVCGGSDTYIAPLVESFKERICLRAGLRSVMRANDGVTLTFATGQRAVFDEVVFACHGDQVLPLLADPSDLERAILSQFTTTANQTVLHTDSSVLPSSPRARASWNYRLGAAAQDAPSLTYDLNRLQDLTTSAQYCVTLNPRQAIDPSRVIGRFAYRHPRVTLAAIAAQEQWRSLSGRRRTHFCGAYWRYGFHEDGLMSAQRVAADLGVQW